jgi:Flp pilus assembly protein TadB
MQWKEREPGRNTTDEREEKKKKKKKKRHTSKRRTAVAEKRTNGRKKSEKESLAPAKRLSVFLFVLMVVVLDVSSSLSRR